MKILHLTAGIGRSNGVMSVILNYASHVSKDIKFDVLYFVSTDDDRIAELKDLGGQATEIDPPGLHSLFRDDVDGYLEAHRGEYAAIHIHLPYLAGVIAPKARRAGIGKVLVHSHSTWFSMGGSELRNKLLNMPTKRLADELIACGREAGAVWYGKHALETGRVTVLPNAIECDKFRFDSAVRKTVRNELGLDDRLTLACVGTLTDRKNQSFLIRLAAQMKKRGTDPVLLLVGDGPMREELAGLADELGVDRDVMLLGNRPDVARLMQGMDVFLLPSLMEGLPVCAIEAQAAGLPVIMSDTVTDETCITDVTTRLSLEAPLDKWADEVFRLAKLPRTDTTDIIRQAGFDLEAGARKLERLYGYGDKEK